MTSNTNKIHEFKAQITLVETLLNGRESAILSGYRPAISFHSSKQYCGELTIKNADKITPGQSAYVVIKLLPAKTIPKSLDIGDTFTLLEGNKKIGYGMIIKEFSNSLNKKEIITQ